MGNFKNISQKAWTRGLAACFDFQSQPKGSVPRCTNMVLTRRGAWKTCDGTALISSWNGAVQPVSADIGRILEVYLYLPIGLPPETVLLEPLPTIPLPGVDNFNSLTDAGGGGNLSAGVYKWVITGLDGLGGETTPSAFGTLTLLANHSVNLVWPAGQVFAGFNIYRTIAGGSVFMLVNPTPILFPATTYNDNVADANLLSRNPPLVNSTSTTGYFRVPPVSYGFANLLHEFPAVSYPGSLVGMATPYGGVQNALDAIPQIIQFANLLFLALGNGFAPYTSDGTGAGTIAITNTFTAAYPAWGAMLAFAAGDVIAQVVGGTNYVFTAIQGGITGAAPPTWPAGIGQTVADGAATSAILWKNTGQVSNSPPPRGAAHVEVYAGSLWVANTSPTISSDQLDGPSAIRMSDANNPNSWNPLNAAQIAKDNGQQITGIKAFAVAAAGIPTTQQLAVFKDFSTFLINGVFGAGDFSIQQAQTDMGLVASRSLQFVPGFGLMRLTHLGFAVFDGLNDRVNSEEIRPYLFGGQDDILPLDWNYVWNCKGAQTAEPPMYVCACPVSAPAAQPLTWATVGTTVQANLIAAGVYYAILTQTGPDGTVYESPEFGPLTIDATHGFNVNITAFPHGATNFALYYGLTPGQEGTVITFGPVATPAPQNVPLNEPGVPGFVAGTGALTRIFCFDLVLKAWTGVIDLPFAINAMKQFRLPNNIPQTVLGGFSDGALRQWQAGDAQWDAGAANTGNSPNVAWSLQPAEAFTEGATQRLYIRRIVLRGIGIAPVINVVPVLNGLADPVVQAAIQALGMNQFDARVDIQQTVENMHTVISGSTPVEIDAQDLQISPKPIGAPAVVFS